VNSVPVLEQDSAFHRWVWRLERIAWGFMLLIVVAALLGLFGRGLLSHGHLHAADGSLDLRYDRFVQVSSETVIDISIPARESRLCSLWINRSYFDRVEIKQMIPNPRALELSGDGWLYTFGPGPAGKALPVRLLIVPRQAGGMEGCVNTGGRTTLCFQQFVYP